MAQRNECKQLTADTKRLLKSQEERNVDFKVKPDGVKAEDFVALANAQGGSILVGVEEKRDKHGKQYGVVVGCSISEQSRQGFISTAASCRPSIDISVRIENLEAGQPIYRIDVPEGTSKPYCTGAGIYKIRVQGQNIAIDPPLMKAIILQQEADEFVMRFKAAADELLKHIDHVHKSLDKQVRRVERAARDAEKAAVEAGLWGAA